MQTFDEIRQLAEQGLTGPQIEMGHSYLTGRDPNGAPCEVNFALAREWFEKAHAKGAHTATYLLGTMYEDGLGVPADVETAIELHTAAAERRSYPACLSLARIYANGKGVTRSPSRAAVWYRRVLAAQSEVEIPEDMAEAREFFNREGFSER